jgi:membrane protein DedA with SNARE-associated domain
MAQTTQHIPQVVQTLAPVLHRYGYLAVGGMLLLEDFGLLVPGETVLIAAAFYAGLGHLNIYLVFVIGLLGAVVGDNIGFAIGRYGGHPLVVRLGKYVFLTPARIKKVEDLFRRQGGKIILVARFFDGLRQANGIIAGVTRMRWRTFLTFNVIGATIWVGFWSGVGYFGGNHISLFLRYQWLGTFALVTFIAGYVAFRLVKRRQGRRSGLKAA